MTFTFANSIHPHIDPEPTVAAETAVQAPVVQHVVLNHLLEYPVLHAGHDTLLACPIGKTVVDSTLPSYTVVRNLQPVKIIADYTNSALDKGLTTIDSWAPSLKTLEVHDLTDPVTQPLGALHLAVVKTVVEPTAKKVLDVKLSVHSVLYNKDGKAIIPSFADPVVSPVNAYLERSIENWLPGTHKVTGEQSSEIARTCMILTNMVTQKRVPPEAVPSEAVPAHEVS